MEERNQSIILKNNGIGRQLNCKDCIHSEASAQIKGGLIYECYKVEVNSKTKINGQVVKIPYSFINQVLYYKTCPKL